MSSSRKKENSETRVPPQNLEAEMSVLGALMLDKEAIFRVTDFLSPKDFYKPAHQKIYEAMMALSERREPIDVLSVTNALKEKGLLDEIGGVSYLTGLVNSVPTASHIVHYAQIVNKKRVLRDLIDASYHIAQLGYKEGENIEELIDEAEQKIFGISQNSTQKEFLRIGKALGEAWERIDMLHKGDGALRGVPTGFPDLDACLAGLQKSDLIVLAARPGLGKTSLALAIASNVALEAKKPVGFFSIEMSRDQVVDRLIAAQAKVNLWHLRTGKLSHDGEDFKNIMNAMDKFKDAALFIDDTPSPTVMQIRAMARRLQAENDLGLIVIDYLQLIKGHEQAENRVQEVSQISRSLKALAKELNVPVLAISQLSRAVEMRTDAKPKLSDLRESGSIEQDADVVMFIYREDKVRKNVDENRKNVAEILIEKHRNGPTGLVELVFNPDQASFSSIAKNFDIEPF